MPSGGHEVVEVLRQRGVKYVFGLPAVHLLPIYDALYDIAQVKHIQVKHEQAAAFMAMGYAMASGSPGTCLLGAGPGATNAVTAVSEAFLDSIPLVILAGGIKDSVRGRGAMHEVNQLEIFEKITKHSYHVSTPERIEATLQRAYMTAASGRPRPVFVELPFDVLSAEVSTRTPEEIVLETQQITSEKVGDAAALLVNSEKPVIIAGGGSVSSGATVILSQFAEFFSSPVATTIGAKGAYPEGNDLSLGLLYDEVASKAIRESDVVLALGCRFSERSTKSWTLEIPELLIQVDIDSSELGRNYKVRLGIHGDIREFLDQLLNLFKTRGLGAPPRRDWLAKIDGWKRSRWALLDAESWQDARPIKPQYVIRELQRSMPEDSVIAADTGYAFWWSSVLLTTEAPRRFLSPSGNVSMGFALPAALGAKCALPDKTVVSITGDGGFLMVCQEIATAVEYELPITVIIMNDSGFGAIREYQKKSFGERYVGVDYRSPDYVLLAKSFGAEGWRVDNPEDLQPIMRTAFQSDRPSVIDVRIDRSERVLPEFLTDSYKR